MSTPMISEQSGNDSRFLVAGIGEILWDLLPTGPMMGGAPGNFAYHAQSLGADASVISRVGADDLGYKILENLRALGVQTRGISTDLHHPTGTVAVRLQDDGQPQFTIREEVAWDYLEADRKAREIVSGADAVCFGTLAMRSARSRDSIRELVAATAPRSLRVFDVNLRQNYYSSDLLEESLAHANVLKLNDVELPKVMGLLGIHGSEKEQIAILVERYELRMFACTRGIKGSLLYDGVAWCDYPGHPVKVKDTIGAGDSFTACVVMGMLAGWEIKRISDLANSVAAYVCTCEGATPALPAHFHGHFCSGAKDGCYV